MAWQDRPYNREESYSYSPSPFSGKSVTTWLIIINVAVFVIDAVVINLLRLGDYSPSAFGAFQLHHAVTRLQLWRWVTYQFLHANLMHLAFNMLSLYFFGRFMEQWWGPKRYLAFYLLCGMSGAYVYWLLAYLAPGLIHATAVTQLVGASGSVYGLLIGTAIIAPDMKVMLLIPPIPISMRALALVVLGIASLLIITGGQNAGGEAAHLGGAALGALLVKYPTLLAFASNTPFTGFTQSWRRRRKQKLQQSLDLQDQEVDRILAKVKDHGLHSLSDKEKRTLQNATNRQRRAS